MANILLQRKFELTKNMYANEFYLCILLACVFDTATIIRY